MEGLNEKELVFKDEIKLKKMNFKTSIKTLPKYLGPAFIVSVAYIDPGNFATNISSGSTFNYSLLWVILWSNLMAIFLQTLSAKLGIATDKNLAEMCREYFSFKINCFLWVISSITSMATTLAEFLGGVLGLYLLFNIPLTCAGILIVVITFIIINLQRYGQKLVEKIIGIMIGIIGISYIFELFLSKPNMQEVTQHILIPSIPNSNAVLIAASMLGATVMPHVIYLHSDLVQTRNNQFNPFEKIKHLKMEKLDIKIAMNISFIINAAMVIVSAAVFYSKGIKVDTIEKAHASLNPLLGKFSSTAFGIALLFSGLSSSAVGAMAGEKLMNGFIKLKLNINIRRTLTMLPGLLIILAGINPMKALVISQVVLSFTLPSAIIPLLIISNDKSVMGEMVNKKVTKILGWIIALMIIGLNVTLLFLTFTSKL